MPFFKPYPQPLAQTRLKSNLFLLFLSFLIRTIFTPYRSIRRVLVESLSLGWVVRLSESVIVVILLFNVAEATWSVMYPPVRKVEVGGMRMTPSRVSSPLTRAYPTPDRISSPLTQSSSLSLTQSTALSLTPSKPSHQRTNSNASASRLNTPTSTSKMFNLPGPKSTNSNTGLFYDPNDSNSPSKVGRPPGQEQQQDQGNTGASTGSGPGVGGEFVLVDREEKEWVDNVWKGVLGKSGRVGI